MSTCRIVAIHQPNFLPWLGFFAKLVRCDVFIALDSVQFAKTQGTWTNRVRILVNGRPTWLTVPVDRSYHGYRQIREMRISNARPWRRRLVASLQMTYGRAPYFKEVFPRLVELLEAPDESLVDYNVRAITAIATALAVDTTKVVSASSLACHGSGTDLLIALVQAVGGGVYMCGGGAGQYQDDARFAAAGVPLMYQSFQHPEYPQFNSRDFVPGLSVVDALMNCGFQGTRNLLDASGAV